MMKVSWLVQGVLLVIVIPFGSGTSGDVTELRWSELGAGTGNALQGEASSTSFNASATAQNVTDSSCSDQGEWASECEYLVEHCVSSLVMRLKCRKSCGCGPTPTLPTIQTAQIPPVPPTAKPTAAPAPSTAAPAPLPSPTPPVNTTGYAKAKEAEQRLKQEEAAKQAEEKKEQTEDKAAVEQEEKKDEEKTNKEINDMKKIQDEMKSMTQVNMVKPNASNSSQLLQQNWESLSEDVSLGELKLLDISAAQAPPASRTDASAKNTTSTAGQSAESTQLAKEQMKADLQKEAEKEIKKEEEKKKEVAAVTAEAKEEVEQDAKKAAREAAKEAAKEAAESEKKKITDMVKKEAKKMADKEMQKEAKKVHEKELELESKDKAFKQMTKKLAKEKQDIDKAQIQGNSVINQASEEAKKDAEDEKLKKAQGNLNQPLNSAKKPSAVAEPCADHAEWSAHCPYIKEHCDAYAAMKMYCKATCGCRTSETQRHTASPNAKPSQ